MGLTDPSACGESHLASGIWHRAEKSIWQNSLQHHGCAKTSDTGDRSSSTIIGKKASVNVPRDFDGLSTPKLHILSCAQKKFAGCQLSMHSIEGKPPYPAKSSMKSNLGVDHSSASISRRVRLALAILEDEIPLALQLEVIAMCGRASIWLPDMHRMARDCQFCNVVAFHEFLRNDIERAFLDFA